MNPAKEKMPLGRILPLALLGAAILVFSAGQAQAEMAVGAYVDSSGGSGKFEWDRENHDFDVNTDSGAVGFALNSRPTSPSPLNYRLNIAFEAQNLEDEFDATLKMNGVVVENVFGISFINQPDLRWWAGPLLRVGYFTGETDDHHDDHGDRYKTEADLAEFGAGFVTGVNFRIGRYTYLAPAAGVRFIRYTGSGTVKDLDTHTRTDDDLTGRTTNFFVNCALLFD